MIQSSCSFFELILSTGWVGSYGLIRHSLCFQVPSYAVCFIAALRLNGAHPSPMFDGWVAADFGNLHFLRILILIQLQVSRELTLHLQ